MARYCLQLPKAGTTSLSNPFLTTIPSRKRRPWEPDLIVRRQQKMCYLVENASLSKKSLDLTDPYRHLYRLPTELFAEYDIPESITCNSIMHWTQRSLQQCVCAAKNLAWSLYMFSVNLIICTYQVIISTTGRIEWHLVFALIFAASISSLFTTIRDDESASSIWLRAL